MTYTIEIRSGHHIVDMVPTEGTNETDVMEVVLEVLKCMTGYKALEAFSEALSDYRGKNKWMN